MLIRSFEDDIDHEVVWKPGLKCRCLCMTIQSTLVPSMGSFSTWIVDESSQISDVDLFYQAQLLSVNRMAFVGDYRQNPTVTVSYDVGVEYCNIISLHHASAIMITDQYRMTPLLGDFIRTTFYDGRIRSMTKAEKGDEFVLVPTSGVTKVVGSGKYVNYGEIDMLNVLELRARASGYKLSVLCMYQSMVQQVRMRKPHLDVYTVDSAQGKTLDSVCMLMTMLNSFTLKDHRLNVALSRAKHQCYVVFSECQSCSHKNWQALTSYCGLVTIEAAVVFANAF